MKLINRETKEEVDAIKNEDGTYTVDGVIVKKDDMARLFMKPKEETPKSEVVNTTEIIQNSWQSDTLGSLALALSKAQSEFESVNKSTTAYNYKYATLADTLTMIRPIMAKYELAITQLTISKMHGDNLLSGIKSILVHSSGEYVASECYLPAKETKSNNIAQVQGSWGSYLRRYHIMSMLNLSTEDKDGQV
jgi:hypothetical protein